MRAALLYALVALALMFHFGSESHHPAPYCAEDMACWNCHTMGNRICGPGR